MQMAKTSAVLERLKIAGVPYVSVMTDPVYGGVSASLAMLGDQMLLSQELALVLPAPILLSKPFDKNFKRLQRSEFLLKKVVLI